ncbi:MAG: PDZ domain-containing protein, partial [Planctomycetota bacterium]
KSEDGGRTWTHMGLERSFQIGDIVIHPKNHDVVYVAALGRLYGPNEERGLYRTKDGGKTWEKILYIDDRTGVIDIALKPDDPDVILAATYERQRDGFDTNEPFKKWGPGGGLWRSTDGGDNWTRIEDGLPTVQLGRIGIDWHVKDPNIVYAIVESELIGSGPKVAEPPRASLGIEAVDADAGARITKVVKDGPADKAGLREGDIVIAIGGRRIVTQRGLHKALYDYEPGQRVKLDIVRDRKITTVELTLGKRPAEEAKEEQAEETKEEEEEAPRPGSDADIASRPYGTRLGGQRMNIQDEQGEEGFQYGGVYRSDDAGLTWRRVNSNNPRPMYFSLIRVDPNDPNYVFVGGVSLYWSDDGGKTFHDDGVQSEDGGSTHVDHHAMWVDPDDGRHILLGNDGGLYETFDRMKTWIHHNKFAIGQYYHVGVDTRPVYNVYGGLQDNGSWGGPSRVRNDRGPINEDWFRVGGGDGFMVFVDPKDPSLVYYESQNGFIARRDLRTGESAFLRPSPP